MKPPPFDYVAPGSLEEALAVLAEHGDDGKVLAGGQSLIPLLNFRLAAPALLIDLGRVPGLGEVAATADGGISIGAMARQRRLETEAVIRDRAPLLALTAPFVAHPQIRNRGTVGGSLAHADPAGELPAVAVAVDARFTLASVRGSRVVPARDFFVALLTTALASDELLVRIDVPPPPPRTGWAFQELARRHGDYAQAGVAARVTLAPDGSCEDARLVFLSVGDVPIEARSAAEVLRGNALSEEAFRAAADRARGEIDPSSDIHASADYKRHVAGVLAMRALTEAARAARGESA